MDAGITAAIIAAIVSAIGLMITAILNVVQHKANYYKDTIAKFKLDWIDKVREHCIELSGLLMSCNNSLEIDKVFFKTDLYLNTNDLRRTKLRTASANAVAATKEYLSNSTTDNGALRTAAVQNFVEEARKCLELEWLYMRTETVNSRKRLAYYQKILRLAPDESIPHKYFEKINKAK